MGVFLFADRHNEWQFINPEGVKKGINTPYSTTLHSWLIVTIEYETWKPQRWTYFSLSIWQASKSMPREGKLTFPKSHSKSAVEPESLEGALVRCMGLYAVV